MQFRSLDDVRRAARHQPTRAFSFDVFDTFLMRRCTAPDGVFELAFHRGPVAQAYRGAVENFAQHRAQAEAKARARKKAECGSVEVTLTEIYDVFPFRLFKLDRAQLPELVAAEFQAERELCLTNPDMRLLFEELRASGVQTGFISDTYWTGPQLATLLTHCAPGLSWDFLYASCDHGAGKRDGLFACYLADHNIIPSSAIHIGDNGEADVTSARRHGLRAIHHPQATPYFIGVLQREGHARSLLCSSGGTRLDQGLSALRRVVAARLPEPGKAFELGATVLGPVMAAFDRFVADRVERLAQTNAKVAVAFLARDGALSLEVWRKSRTDAVHYLELNRRCSLVGSATTPGPLVDLFQKIHSLNAALATDILKIDSPRLRAFFSAFPGGIAPGKDFADALPDLIAENEIVDVAATLRRALLVYMRRAIPDFDACTDLVLVDLGYSASVQKALRKILDAEGIRIRLHGLYLLSVDEAFEEIVPTDTAEGFISDLVVTPHVNRMLMRNVAILEQLCCSPDGSVCGYRDGEVLREPDPRSPAQIAVGQSVQRGALHFTEHLATLAASYALVPFGDVARSADDAVAVLGRFLALPTDDELVLLGGLEHDVNLGTQTTIVMADPIAVDTHRIAAALPAVCAAAAPPMWMAASMAGVAPVYGYLYALYGAGRLPGDLFADVPCGRIEVGLGSTTDLRRVEVTCLRSGFADVRIRVPLRREMGTQVLSIPIGKIAPEGLIHGVTVQTGATAAEAISSREVRRLPAECLKTVGIDLAGCRYRTRGEGPHELLIVLPALSQPIAIVSLLLQPMGGARVLALAPDGEL